MWPWAKLGLLGTGRLQNELRNGAAQKVATHAETAAGAQRTPDGGGQQEVAALVMTAVGVAAHASAHQRGCWAESLTSATHSGTPPLGNTPFTPKHCLFN